MVAQPEKPSKERSTTLSDSTALSLTEEGFDLDMLAIFEPNQFKKQDVSPADFNLTIEL